MVHETHTVRFKIVSIKCSVMPEGQQYTVFYRRGDTSRSTPCYIAHGGMVVFSSMPEGAAVIHFKRGHGGRRYAPKYIQFRVEEYTRGAPRRTVGETELDCTLACVNNHNVGSRILQVNFRLYGVEAVMRVAVLVYPEGMPPLSFDNLITPSEQPAAKAEEPPMEVKAMGRGEAMALLISLETMLERKKSEEAAGKAQPVSRAEKRLKELEERRKALTGTEGMATRVVTERCGNCIDAQFVALARKFRNNYIGATAAYLRQLALQSGVPLTGDDAASESMDEDTTREMLTGTSKRMGELGQEVKRLEEQQIALGRLQDRMDVTQELCANLEKVAALDAQIKLLQQSKDALEKALRSRGDAANTPVNREVRDINERIKTVTGEQEQLRAKVKHMTAVAAGHVLSWARAKNPPEPEHPKTNVDDLFSEAKATEKQRAEKDLADIQRKQILSAFEGLKPSAPPATARSTSASSSSGHRTPRDIFGATDLPSMGDFTDRPAKEAKPQYQDPLKPAGLASNMFAAEPPKPAARNDIPDMAARGEFSFGASSNTRNAPPKEEVFDFGAIMRQAETTRDDAGNTGGGGGGFTLSPTGPLAFQAAPPTNPPVSFDSPQTNMFEGGGNAFGSGLASQRSPPPVPANNVGGNLAKNDNPYYDDIDDYTVPPDVAAANAGGVTVEFGEDFNFGVDDGSNKQQQQQPSLAPANTSSAPPPRPTFNFGPSDDAGVSDTFGSGQPTAAGFTLEGGPTVSFGDDDDSGSTANRGNTGAGFTNLPTYNFGS